MGTGTFDLHWEAEQQFYAKGSKIRVLLGLLMDWRESEVKEDQGSKKCPSGTSGRGTCRKQCDFRAQVVQEGKVEFFSTVEA